MGTAAAGECSGIPGLGTKPAGEHWRGDPGSQGDPLKPWQVVQQSGETHLSPSPVFSALSPLLACCSISSTSI